LQWSHSLHLKTITRTKNNTPPDQEKLVVHNKPENMISFE